ncbi:MAG TPA: PKD domain-containing protein [Thermoanaerobaculia bacterium]|nr:PKD domain-containing protein [Thermoanaerobaculia bacterium]
MTFRNPSLRRGVAALLSYLVLLQPVALQAASMHTSGRPQPPRTVAAAAVATRPAGDFEVLLKPLTTPFHAHSGIDHHAPSDSVVAAAAVAQSASLELIAANGQHRPFANPAGLPPAAAVAAVRATVASGFTAGEVFTSTASDGIINRVAADGSSFRTIALAGETGKVTALHVEEAALLAVTDAGSVWSVNAAGTATRVATMPEGLASVATVPNDVPRYGPLAGKILAGASGQPLLYAIDATGAATSYPLTTVANDIAVVPPHQNFYAVDSAAQKIAGAPDDAFASLIGDILIAQTAPGVLAHLRWNGTQIEASQLAQASRFDAIAFSPAGLAEIVAVQRVYDALAVVRHAPVLSSGRVEGSLWQLAAEDVTLDGTDVITHDLLLPGTPQVVIGSGKPSFGGVIEGTESAQPSTHTFTIANNAVLRHLVNRTDAIQLAPVAAPPAATGTRDVSLTKASDSAGDFATLRNLTISGQAGAVAVPPGTYGAFQAGGRTAFVLGVSGSTTPTVYNLKSLSLGGGSELRLAGPVVLNVADAVTLTGSTVGAPTTPKQLLLNAVNGPVQVTGKAILYGIIRAPSAAIAIDGNSRIRGTVTADTLAISGNGVLEVTENDLPPPAVNRPPSVDAGADQTTTLPADTISLGGTATDDGLPANVTLAISWSQVSGPAGVTFGNANEAATTATFATPGTYVLRLTANDSLLASSDEVTITVIPRNQAPEANAGDDQTIELPGGATLVGSISDDGLPMGSTLTSNWRKVDGPGAVTFADAAALSTTVTFGAAGTYTIELAATDGELSATDTVVITVHPENQPPAVNAGPDQTIIHPATAPLSGTATDDGWPQGSTLVSLWTKVSGPGTVAFANPVQPATTAAFSAAGEYVLRLTATDGRETVSDDVAITVDPENEPPVARAGGDLTIELPNPAALNGTVTDDGWPRGSTLISTWSVLDGPGSVAFGDASQPVTTAVFTVAGTYTLRLTATDGAASDADDVVITVHPENQAPVVSAGPDATVELPNAGTLAGTVTDDGWPAGSTVTSEWTKVSGPGSVSFADPTAPVSAATFGAEGTYVLRLTATDSRLTVSDDVTVTVYPANQAPVVEAGEPQTIRLPAAVALTGTASDDGWPFGSTLTSQWTQVSGPGTVTFANAAQPVTAATFSVAGTYVLRLSASDTRENVSDEVTITVLQANEAPAVDAGPDQAASLHRNLLTNGGNEQPLVDEAIPGWTGSGWTKGASFPASAEGDAFFAAPAAGAELTQDIDLSLFPATQTYTFAAMLRGDARVIVEYRDVAGNVVQTFSPDGQTDTGWTRVTDTRVAPPGTVSVRIRLIATTAEAYFDAVTFRAVGTAAVKLAGSAADDGFPEGNALSTEWSVVGGPGAVVFANANAAATNAAFTVSGTYTLRLTATDGELTVTDEVIVNIDVANTPPVVEAGTDDDVKLPSNATLNALVSDDGLPAGELLSIQWSVLAAPAPPVFGDSASAATTVTFTAPGTYVLRLSASDSQKTIHDELTIVVRPANRGPIVNAGFPQTIVLPSTATLNGAAVDPEDQPLTLAWSVVSGPGSVVFANPASAVTTASFSEAGEYVLRLTATDGELSDSDDVTVTVEPEPVNRAPVVEAGADATTQVAEGLALNGTVSDDGLPGGVALSVTWSMVSGPGTATFADATAAGTVVTFDRAGTYVLRLTASDSLLTSSDELTVTVRSAPVASFTIAGPERAAVTIDNNLASTQMGALVVASSGINSASFLADFAFDDVATTRWRSPASATPAVNQFLVVQLAGNGPRTFDRFRITNQNSTEGIRNFRVDVSTTTADNAAFTTVYTGIAGATDRVQEYRLAAPATARYVRLFMADAHGSTVMSIRGFAVIGAGLSGLPTYLAPANLAVTIEEASVIAQTFGTGANALDGNPATGWATSSTRLTNQSFTIDLGMQHAVNRVRVFNLDDTRSTKDFRIEVSNDNVTYTTAFTGTALQPAGAQEFTFPAVPARYVRFFAVNNYGSTAALGIRDLEVLSAYAGQSSVSSYSGAGNGPENLFDQDVNTYWMTASGRTTNQSVDFELGGDAPALVDGVLIHTFNGTIADALKDFELLASADGTTFTAVVSGTVLNSGVPQRFVLPGGPIRARFFRFVAKNNYGSTGNIRVGLMHLLTEATEGNLVSAPGTAAAYLLKNDSPAHPANGAAIVAQSSGSPVQMLDWATSSPWSTSGSFANQFVKIQLAGTAPRTLTGIVLGQRSDTTSTTDAVKDFEVWVSTTTSDDAAFTRILTAAATTAKALQTFSFPAVEAKYVKYVPKTTHGSTTTVTTGYFDVVTEPVAQGVFAWSSHIIARQPQLALDGNTGTGWVSAAPATDQWIRIALPELKKLYGVTVTGDSSFAPKDIEIRVSSTTTDASAFTTIYTGTLANSSAAQPLLFGRTADVRYVELFFRNAYVTTGIGVREVGVLPLPQDGATLIAYSTPSTTTFAGSSILDVNTTTGLYLSANNLVSNLSFVVALPPAQSWVVDHVAVQQRIDCGSCPTYGPRQVEIQAATDDNATAWQTVWSGTLRGNDNRLQHIFFPAVSTRSIRLVVLNNWGATQVGIQNLFVYTPQMGALTARFIDRSEPGDAPIESYQWQFGDGGTSTERDPLHVYAEPGEYDVRLTVVDGNGLTSTKSISYRVEGAPRVDFTIVPQPGNEGSSLTFTDISSSDFGPIATRQWVWGDGTTNGGNVVSTTHPYADNGTYNATLTVTSQRGITGTLTKPVTVLNVAPTVEIGANKSFPWGENWGVTATINDASSVDRTSIYCTWDFGDGQTLERANCRGTVFNHVYAVPGTYTATLVVRDKDGATATDSATYTVTPRPTVISYGGGRGVIPGEPLVLSATLRDDITHDFITNKTIQFTIEGQTASAITNAEGFAETTVIYNGAATTPVVLSAFAGDALYGASSVSVLASCPADQQPIDVALVFDLSGSMLGERLTAARSGALIFLDSLQRNQDQAAAVSFTGSGIVEQALTYDLDAVREAIDEMNASGGTDVGAGINTGRIELLSVRRNPYARPIMILYSDGETGRDSAINAANLAKAAGIRIISVMIGGSATARQLMKDIASGPGDYYEATQTTELSAIYASIVSSICEPANQPPIVDPGSDRTIVFPVNSVTLSGTVTDDGRPPLATLTTTWSKDSGPGTVTFADATKKSTTATFSAVGTYVLRLSANDTQYVRSSSITINVYPENQPPVVDAGADRTIGLPSVIPDGPTTTTITLTGSVTDDGWPFGSSVSQEWTLVSGPATPLFETPAQPSTKITFAVDGTYVLRLTATDTEDTVSDDVTIVVEPGNRAPEVSAGPDVPATLSAGATLNGTVTDDGRPNGSSVTVTWTQVSGPAAVTFATPDAAVTTATFPLFGTYVLRLMASDGELSATDDVTVTVDVTPGNQAPVVNAGADISLTDPVNTATLTGSVTDDGIPSSTLGIGWVQLSGPVAVVIAEPSSPVTAVSFPVHGTYVFRLSAGDGELSSSDEVTVTFSRTPGNLAPVVNAGADATIVAPTNSIALTGTATDDGLPNGSSVTATWTKVSGPGLVTFADASAPATMATFSVTGIYVLRLTATDSELSASDTVTIRHDGVNAAPAVNAGPDATARANEIITLGGSVTDDNLPLGSSITISWSKVSGPGTVTFANTSLPNTQARFSAMGTYVLRLTANDSALSASDSVTYTVDAPAPPPVAAIMFPASGATVTERTVFTGTVADGATWRLEYRLNPDDATGGTNPWTTIASGSGPVTNGTLGTFDPTGVVNGTYKVRLVVQDPATGQTSAPFITAVADGDLKVGAFTIGFTDLEIPLPGMTLNVTRNYDSRDTRVGDFGHGWRLGLSGIRIEKSGELGSGWQQTVSSEQFPRYCLVAASPRFVTFTFPTGKVYRFRLAVTPSCQLFLPIQTPTVFFEPVGTTKGSLKALGDNFVMSYGSVPGPVDLITSDVEIYDPSRFELTDEDGIVYEIDERLGVRKITDRAKNTLTISSTGVVHSTGRSVSFGRDSAGRISTITDAEGKILRYTYDGSGDLVTVTDQSNRATTFTYNSNHGILDYFDSMGRRGIKSEYDSTGRLIALTDADGHVQTFTFDPNSRNEVVTDRRGKTLVYEYDERGNTLSITDADGKARRATYDTKNNMLTSTDKLGQVTTYEYDPAGNVTVKKDHEGRISRYTYNSFKQITSATDPNNETTAYEYDPVTGNLLKVTDAEGNLMQMAYDFHGRLETVTDARNKVRRFAYDNFGNVTRETHENGKATTYTYDAMGRRLTMTDPYNRTTTYAYDDAGRMKSMTDHLGNTITDEFDGAGAISGRIDARGNKTAVTVNAKGLTTNVKTTDDVEIVLGYEPGDVLTSVNRGTGYSPSVELNDVGEEKKFILAPGIEYVYELDEEGRRKSETDPLGHKTSFTWNTLNKMTSRTDALSHTTAYEYDGAGNVKSLTDSNQRKTTYTYDGLNRMTKSTLANGFSHDYTYDGVGNNLTSSDPRGNLTTFTWTADSMLDTVKEANNVTSSMTYDDNLNRTSYTNGRQKVVSYAYDELNRLRLRTYPDGSTESFTYIADAIVESKTDRMGRTTTYTYDKRGRISTITRPGGATTSLTYTSEGRIDQITDASGVIDYDYDVRNHVTRFKQADGTVITYTYDLAGNRESMTTPEGTTAFTYDAANRLETVTDPHGHVTHYGYDAGGNVTRVEYPNGMVTTNTYDELNLVDTTTTVDPAGTTLFAEAYDYDEAGNRTSIVAHDGATTTLTYDVLSRLDVETQRSSDGTVLRNLDYDYDATGNRSSVTDLLANTTTAYAINDLDQVVSDGQRAYTYDGNGNMKTAGPAVVYDYDVQDRLESSTVNGVSVSYLYDAEGRRLRENDGTLRDFVIDPVRRDAEVVLERDGGSNIVASYTHGHELISAARGGQEVYYVLDGMGSVRAITDANGAVTDLVSYDAFGRITGRSGTTPNDYFYRGERLDRTTGLYHLRARDYDPSLGRFIEIDTFQGKDHEPQTRNRYVYALNNPASRIDPSGHVSRGDGTIFHGIIGAYYESYMGGYGVSGRGIAKGPHGAGTGKKRGGLGKFPDLREYLTGDVYEIKPLSPYGLTAVYAEAFAYAVALNIVEPGAPEFGGVWHMGIFTFIDPSPAAVGGLWVKGHSWFGPGAVIYAQEPGERLIRLLEPAVFLAAAKALADVVSKAGKIAAAGGRAIPVAAGGAAMARAYNLLARAPMLISNYVQSGLAVVRAQIAMRGSLAF